jgi:YidC/Oxa1 family membrane protein insertase
VSSEQRVFLAIVLMGAVWILYPYFLGQQAPPSRNASTTTQAPATPEPERPTAPAAPAPAPAPLAPSPAAAAENRPPQRLARVSSALYDATISSEGGKLQGWTLRYRGDKPMIIVGDLGSLGVVIGSAGGGQGEIVPFQVSSDTLSLGPDRPSGELRLTGAHRGLRVEQTLGFRADAYTIEARLQIQNTTNATQNVVVSMPWMTRQAWHEAHEKFGGQHPTEVVWQSAHRVHRHELCDVPPVAAEGDWIGFDSKFYLAALAPKSPGFQLVTQAEDKKVCEAKTKEPVGRAVVAVQATPTLAPQQTWEGAVLIYVGPKEYDRLRASGLEGTLNFGSFLIPQSFTGGQPVFPMSWLAVPILLILDWVHRHVGNYGLAIILLTIVSKVLFYPLTVKSMRSMKAMQALQPQINALRNKYKSDPQRLQKETMDLYRANSVNPIGGCLPMFAQVPIFYALYLALDNAADLQGAPFICFGHLPSWVPGIGGSGLWICDLAAPDPLYVLPILMGVTMFMQQKMTPTGADPRQAKMMLFMPFIFTLMFFNLASGLVLYWTVSNVLQILQQWYMDRPKRRAAQA